MRHEEIWYICDRCGEKIPYPCPTFPYGIFRCNKILNLKAKSYEARTYINEMNALLGTDLLEISTSSLYDIKENRIELCGKCRKDFEKFMKNKRIEK